MNLTEQELRVIDMTADLWNAIALLGGHQPSDMGEFERDIHSIQHRVMARAAIRAHPVVFRQPVLETKDSS